ncbi:thioredoxin domain-containing protein [Lysinibacter sp. HNR]|uniref:DsbA family protein n=1 Tax=Lysinibacter sp. HNR TaxID=3031408 RepID=UPI002434E861|nr:thioredoxin domain-containing protein [Lysinibacter sp. HNR]WGD37011.1 thioredoxin domain-containing protein [Lysinibacter sp. HNR]
MADGKQGRVTKNERREQAREQARVTREKQKKKEKRNRLFLQGGVAVVLLGIATAVTLLIVQAVQPPGPGPANMASYGLVVGQDLQVENTVALQPDDKAITPEPDRTTGPVDVVVYTDYICPYCGQFDQANATLLENMAGSGEITLELRPLAVLDAQSMGSRYSTRAANAFACVADLQPEAGLDFHTRLLSEGVQPAEGTRGLTDDELLEQMSESGVNVDQEMRSCVTNRQFSSFISRVSESALSGPLPNTELEKVTGTPTVLVNGEQYRGAPGDGAAFQNFLLSFMAETPADQGTNNQGTNE